MEPVTNTENAATDISAPQGDTVSDVVKDADTTNESTLLDSSIDSKSSTDTQTEAKQDSPDSTSDLLGDIEQPEGNEVAPDTYEPFTLADGTEMDASDQELLAEIMKDNNLSQESAQKAAIVASELMNKMVSENEAAQAKVLEENATAWKQKDQTGELTIYAQNAVKSLGEEMHAHLKENGYLQDARIMSILADYGKSISEGKSISGRPAPQQALLYPNTPELYNS